MLGTLARRPIAASVLTSRQDAVDVVAYIATLRD
jgi:hypothetical protein